MIGGAFGAGVSEADEERKGLQGGVVAETERVGLIKPALPMQLTLHLPALRGLAGSPDGITPEFPLLKKPF